MTIGRDRFERHWDFCAFAVRHAFGDDLFAGARYQQIRVSVMRQLADQPAAFRHCLRQFLHLRNGVQDIARQSGCSAVFEMEPRQPLDFPDAQSCVFMHGHDIV
ncbi:hypothetical protein LZK73_26890 (plasmid) [Neorhizobium galegae]|nr:hypothetical protein LZK73_26890 [Neorhizobium galegae]